MQQPVNWSNLDQIVNDTTDGAQSNSSVTALQGGGYVIVWTSSVPGEPAVIMAQIYNAFGSKEGGEFEISDPDNTNWQYEPDVAALDNGGFAVSWHGTFQGGSTGDDVHVAVFDGAGDTVKADFLGSTELNDALPGDQANAVIYAASGGFYVAYISREDTGGVGIEEHLMLQKFSNDGTLIGDPLDFAVATDVPFDSLSIGPAADGAFAVTWHMGEPGEADVYYAKFRPSGDQIGNNSGITDAPLAQQSPHVAWDGSGSFLTVFRDGSTSGIKGQFIDKDGNLVARDGSDVADSSFEVSDSTTYGGDDGQPTVIGLRSGGYFVAWSEWYQNATIVMGQLLDTNGNKIGGEVIIKGPDAAGYGSGSIDLAELSDGRIVVSWHDDSHTGVDQSQTGIHHQIIDPRGGDIVGTGYSEMLLGSAYGQGTADTIQALGGNDTLDGYDGNDSLNGGAGNDVFKDDSGADTMNGGDGDDTYHVDSLADVVIENVDRGNDKIIVDGEFDYALGAGIEVETIEMTSTDDWDITGNEFGQLLIGGAGINKLLGMGGNDTLDGGGGATNFLGGGEGDDVYLVREMAEVVSEALNQGNDTVKADFTFSLENRANVENLTLIGTDGIDGTGNDLANKLTGNENDNELFGLGGNDTLDGMGGADTMYGGKGDDYYKVDMANDAVDEAANEGTDTVYATINWTLSGNVEKLTLGGSAANGTGNTLANVLIGNGANNSLYGLDGNDTIDGGAGNDTMFGGKGDDVHIVSQAGDQVKENANEGTDTAVASINYALALNVENLVLKLGSAAAIGAGNTLSNKLTGNDLANTLKGGGGNDTMDGGNGTDSLEGGSGNDSYVLGNGADKVKDSSGIDDLILSSKSRSLASYSGIENLTLTGTAKINGTGNGVANDLVGNSAANQLKGGAGDDLLRGAGGADVLTGGTGNDFFDFNSIAEIGKGKHDIIRDFVHGADKIDLKNIDAKMGVPGNQAFKLVAAEGSAFSHTAGELIWDLRDKPGTAKDVTIVSGDVNGDGTADFQLELKGLVSLTSTDFIL